MSSTGSAIIGLHESNRRACQFSGPRDFLIHSKPSESHAVVGIKCAPTFSCPNTSQDVFDFIASVDVRTYADRFLLRFREVLSETPCSRCERLLADSIFLADQSAAVHGSGDTNMRGQGDIDRAAEANSSHDPHTTNPGAITGLFSGTSANTSTQSRASQRKVHEASGYTWERDEDAPGYVWKNKKARDEADRAGEALIDKDRIVGRKFMCSYECHQPVLLEAPNFASPFDTEAQS